MKSIVLGVIVAAALVSCTTAPDVEYENLPEFYLVPIEATDLVDRREEFAAVFCSELSSALEINLAARPCAEFLHLEGPVAEILPNRDSLVDGGLRFVIVPGLSSECFSDTVTPFQATREKMLSEGIDVDLMMVPGRASSAHNAKIIAAELDANPDNQHKKIVLIGYSKGLPDIFESQVLYPDSFADVVAIVGLGGVVNGSPAADDVGRMMRSIVDSFPISACEANEEDGDAIISITYEHRQNWLVNNRLDSRIKYFSVASYATIDEMSFGLKSSYRKLAEIDARNDGQMIYRDAVIPGSYLLAFLRANHWAVALPIADANSFLGSLMGDNNDYPRSVLLRAIMISVQKELSATLTSDNSLDSTESGGVSDGE
jgi:hypothetical protein